MSRPALLDVNVLVALFDPDHLHHELAHAWFGGPDRQQWATSPLTENGLVRVVSNPKYPGRRTTLEDALQRLRTFCNHQEHAFWADSVTMLDADVVRTASIQGHRQLTDVYLLALAVAHDGVLVTFDRSIAPSAVLGANEGHLIRLAG